MTKHLTYRPCVGIVLINSGGLVFAGQRIDNLGGAHEAWQMPQGGIDEGEEPEAAMWREMGEEIGTDKARILKQTPDWLTYDLPDHLIGKVWRGKYRGQKQMWFAMAFTGNDDDINIETEIPEFCEWRWLTPSEILKSIVPFKRDVYEAVFKEFRDLIS